MNDRIKATNGYATQQRLAYWLLLALASGIYANGCSGDSGSAPTGNSAAGNAGGGGNRGDAGVGGNNGAAQSRTGSGGVAGKRETVTCSELDCGAQGRTCTEATGQADASCGACPHDAGSSETGCQVESCAELGCEELHRTCEESPTPQCNAQCLAGYRWDAEVGGCRLPMTCKDLSCSPSRPCIDSIDGKDAYCKGEKCPKGQGWDMTTQRCRACFQGFAPNCAAEHLTGIVLLSESSENASCMCESEDGYYIGENGAAVPCDADHDSWVSDSAQPSIESQNPIQRTNARCHVRRVTNITLKNEKGEVFEAEDFSAQFGDAKRGVPAGLPLYESARNDGAPSAEALPKYPGRGLAPVEVNSLTKACAPSESSDFNDNGVSDVDESSTSEVTLDKGRGASIALRDYYKKYTRFSHFLELHNGWYEEEPGDSIRKTYWIAERSRADLSGQGVAVLYPTNVAADGTSTADYAQQCARHLDTLYRWKLADGGIGPATLAAPVSSAGGDFTQFGDIGWSGMTHHSQYKCVKTVDQVKYATYNSGTPATEAKNPALAATDPLQNGRLQLGASALIANDCRSNELVAHAGTSGGDAGPADASGVDTGQLPNPVFPSFTCKPMIATPATDTVVLAAVTFSNATQTKPYQSYQDPGDYGRGCINECIDFRDGGPLAAALWPHGFCNTCKVTGPYGTGQIVAKTFGQQPCDDSKPSEGGFCTDAGGCVACGSACSTGRLGLCAPGVYRCDGANTATCEGVAVAAKNCTSSADNDCNGVADREESACKCDGVYANTSESCDPHPRKDGNGKCSAGQRTCQSSGSTAAWGACAGSVGPGTRDCESSSDNDCDGTVDSKQWRTYRTDNDGDKYCFGTTTKVCLGDPPALSRLSSDCLGTDCLDTNKVVGEFCPGTGTLSFYMPGIDFAQGKIVNTLVCDLKANTQVVGFKSYIDCSNDDARSMVLTRVSGGTLIEVFDNPDCKKDDDWTEILTKRDVALFTIDSFENNVDNTLLSVVYHHDNGLDGKVSCVRITAPQ